MQVIVTTPDDVTTTHYVTLIRRAIMDVLLFNRMQLDPLEDGNSLYLEMFDNRFTLMWGSIHVATGFIKEDCSKVFLNVVERNLGATTVQVCFRNSDLIEYLH